MCMEQGIRVVVHVHLLSALSGTQLGTDSLQPCVHKV